MLLLQKLIQLVLAATGLIDNRSIIALLLMTRPEVAIPWANSFWGDGDDVIYMLSFLLLIPRDLETMYD